ncbi:MAG TPA: hydantoinase/oxoprolinase family protein [Candidatus Binatia bacterium]|nr:hydantoinase/oxoprolinase family protein [Candidatus Binatia bacterium]
MTPSDKSFLVGIDVGGTFTDCVLVDSAGKSIAEKTFTTPEDPSQGVLHGLDKLAERTGVPVKDFFASLRRIVHGTTITTNAVLTGRGAVTAFITTEGFRDVLLMRRGVREDQFNSKHAPPPPIVPRHRTYTVSERIDCEGREITAFDRDGARQVLRTLRGRGVEALAVSFLFSFLNPSHEQQMAELITEEFPEAYVSLSIEVLPQLRAYERHSTTALNASVGPILARYLERLMARLEGAGFAGRLLIMQSNGGVMAPTMAARFACRTLLSGPAGGPVAGKFWGERSGHRNLITMDMGGTSFDVSFVKDGEVSFTTEGSVGGHAMAFPALDIRTVGAGGGSIAQVDEGGVLQVGPSSAGATPGPICYGRGGEQPTVTDADLILGYLGVDDFLGGKYRLDLPAAWHGIEQRIANPLGIDTLRAAEGINRLVNSTMADAIRLLSIGEGYDPRECVLIVAGGAGAVHAAAIASELAIRKLLVPREASVFCAAGMLLSDLKHDYVRTLSGELSTLPQQKIERLYREMEAEALSTLGTEGVSREDIAFSYAVDLKYAGQFHELTVPFSLSQGFAGLKQTFDAQHQRLYGYHLAGEPAEALNWRLTAVGRIERPSFSQKAVAGGGKVLEKRKRDVVFDGSRFKVPVFDGVTLSPDMKIAGPAIVEEPTTTVVIPPEWELWVNGFGDYEILNRAEP